MKLIRKSDLHFVADRLVDNDGFVVSQPKLVHDVNEIAELRDLNAFVKANAAKIEAAGTNKVVYHPVKAEVPAFKSGLTTATPLLDEEKATAEAKALEFLEVQKVSDIDAHLDRYAAVAKFIEEDYLEVATDPVSEKFLTNPLDLTAADVVSIVTEYHDPAIAKLRGQVQIDWS